MKIHPENRLTDLLIEFDEMGFCPTTVCPNPEQTAIEWKEQVVKEIQKLQTENAELRERLDKTELPCKVGDTLYEPFINRIREWIVDSIYVFSFGINVICKRKDDYRRRDHFAIRKNYNDFESRVCLTREAAEARLKEIEEEI